MDPLIRKRLKTKVIVHPFIGIKRGDREFGAPYMLYGYVNYREKLERFPTSTETNNYTAIIFDGHEIPPSWYDKIVGFRDNNGKIVPLTWDGVEFILNQGMPLGFNLRLAPEKLSGIILFDTAREVQFANVKPDDEVELPGQGRVPIKVVKAYQGLSNGTQNVEAVI